ncbi:PKD domain-containing protein [Hymenobacter taeanensis]|uniref:PKD domain-containing protein n=1 Tax=Hymenobacter taeanensis TaxID=2735321 RepID=A0A6M6BLS6_9BACT|nr:MULTISPECIES: PKD domain-containing protein [Hymenobacter]QJX48880.1 PKD domain-containing protein [Hymenobacter taeanensis]UOQ81607.1 PKD domain-containing protein [Hymenobacter sp. 5414T-23]
MRHIWNKMALALLASSLLITACDKDDDGQLEGPKPTISFTASTPKVVGLTSEVTFTSTSSDAFLYQWDFGDGTIGSGATVTHVYTKGGTFTVQLIAAGRGGTSPSVTKQVVIVSPLNTVNQLLTGGSSKTWMLDNSVSATIVVGPSDSDPTSYYAGGPAGALPACQADDEFTFSSANVYTYNAKGETLVAGNGGCQAPRSGSTPYTFGAATGAGVAQLTLANAGSFIGITDAPDLVYRILSIDEKHMVLRAGKPNAGVVFTLKLVAK